MTMYLIFTEPAAISGRLAGAAAAASRILTRDELRRALAESATPAVIEALGRTGAEEALVPVLDALGSEASATRPVMTMRAPSSRAPQIGLAPR